MPSGTLNQLLWALALALIVVFGFQARDQFDSVFAGAGRFEVRAAPEDNTVYLRWRGKIEAPLLANIEDAFQRHKDSARTFKLSLSSPGGSLDHGAKVARLLRKIAETHTLETVVEAGSRCASMCVPVYLQGQRRTAAASAKFMFHEVSFREFMSKEDADVPERAKETATDRLFAVYFSPAGVPESWIRSVRAAMAGGRDIWKTGRELTDENAGIVQQVF